MSYNKRLRNDPPMHNMSYQLTIPEMFATNTSESSDNRGAIHPTNIRYPDHGSEHAAAPSTPMQNNGFRPTMCGTPYEAQHVLHQNFAMPHQQYRPQQSYYNLAGPSTPQQHLGHQSYYEMHHGAQAPNMVPCTPKPSAAASHPYYGVPGFYTPNYAQNVVDESDRNDMMDDMYDVTATMPTHRPLQPSTPRRFLTKQDVKSPEIRKHLPSKRPVHAEPSSSKAVPQPSHSVTADEKQKPYEPMQSKAEVSQQDDGEEEKNVSAQHRSVPPSVYFFSGSIRHALKWGGLRETQKILHEVIAPLMSVRDKNTHMELLLRDESNTGPVLQVLFYEIDRCLPQLQTGQMVRVVGRLISKARLQAFSVRAASKVECASLQRITTACQKVATELEGSLPL